jgi:hypothetical protein
MKSGPPKTVKHGGDGGTVALEYNFSGNLYSAFGCSKFAHSLVMVANQKLVAVYGRRLKNESEFGKRKYVSWIIGTHYIYTDIFYSFSIVQLSLVIATEGVENSRDAATIELKSTISHHSYFLSITGSRQLFLRTRWTLPTSPLISLGLLWESLRTLSG